MPSVTNVGHLDVNAYLMAQVNWRVTPTAGPADPLETRVNKHYLSDQSPRSSASQRQALQAPDELLSRFVNAKRSLTVPSSPLSAWSRRSACRWLAPHAGRGFIVAAWTRKIARWARLPSLRVSRCGRCTTMRGRHPAAQRAHCRGLPAVLTGGSAAAAASPVLPRARLRP